VPEGGLQLRGSVLGRCRRLLPWSSPSSTGRTCRRSN
jgi:hypothetical protein